MRAAPAGAQPAPFPSGLGPRSALDGGQGFEVSLMATSRISPRAPRAENGAAKLRVFCGARPVGEYRALLKTTDSTAFHTRSATRDFGQNDP